MYRGLDSTITLSVRKTPECFWECVLPLRSTFGTRKDRGEEVGGGGVCGYCSHGLFDSIFQSVSYIRHLADISRDLDNSLGRTTVVH